MKGKANLWLANRRTGITLKEGKLDEHGMEEIEGIFSSPEKSPVKTNGNGFGNDTLINSEDMETGGSMCLHVDFFSASMHDIHIGLLTWSSTFRQYSRAC